MIANTDHQTQRQAHLTTPGHANEEWLVTLGGAWNPSSVKLAWPLTWVTYGNHESLALLHACQQQQQTCN